MPAAAVVALSLSPVMGFLVFCGPLVFLGTLATFPALTSRFYAHNRNLRGDTIMKSLIRYGLAAALLFATAMPAMARSWVVCVDQNKDARGSTETVSGSPVFIVAAAPVYPGGANVSTATDCTP